MNGERSSGTPRVSGETASVLVREADLSTGSFADGVELGPRGRRSAGRITRPRSPASGTPAPAERLHADNDVRRRGLRGRRAAAGAVVDRPTLLPATPHVDIEPADPFLAYLAQAGGPVELASVEIDSRAVADLRSAGVVMVVPLVSSGELIGALNLGPRLSEQGYSSDDRRLLETLAGYAAPAMRIGQLVHAREVEAREVERIEQELRVAQLIQQQFLPTEVPDLPGFHVAAFYRPARTIGGDFYDFATLPDGRIMFVCGDVTDKGVPAALVMASTHALLREAATRFTSPGQVLASVNEMLCADIPAHMFVTCLAIALDPVTGEMTMANAGHNLPYIRSADGGGYRELLATGMPLGLMPGMVYDETIDLLAPGEGMLLHSDGLAEAHNPDRMMFGFDRLAELVASTPGGEVLIDCCLSELSAFTGAGVAQEDDITLVTVERAAAPLIGPTARTWRTLIELQSPSEPGAERDVVVRVIEAVASLRLTRDARDRLGTAVAETVMNAVEHGNHNDPSLSVETTVRTDGDTIEVLVSDRGGLRELPTDPEIPDLDAKLDGRQRPRGWGLFLVASMVDSMDVVASADDPFRHTARLRMTVIADTAPDTDPASEGPHHVEHL